MTLFPLLVLTFLGPAALSLVVLHVCYRVALQDNRSFSLGIRFQWLAIVHKPSGPGMVVHAVNPTTGEAEVDGSF
ncbi:hypothetical protein I79_022217 [Cricetulus griseus]|uniref:Secreted protein n=1 Tax=Cricetulus griseus TaxID=10029 RepID=G3IER5_CRIGR|nr:hypothetical protein I79_022217 [Cricetulus griseus]